MLNLFGKNSSESEQLNWQETPDGILFTAPSENLSLTEYAANLPTDAHQAQAQWMLLKELLDNGQAESSDSGIHIPNEQICQLESVEQGLLGLPEPYPFDIEIRSHGTFNQAEFRYNYQFLKPDRKSLHPNRIGCVLRLTKEWAYLLTSEQFGLLEALDAFNAREDSEKDFQNNLLEFAKIKGLAKGTGAALDLYLNQEEVVAPQTVRLRLRESGDDVEIIPDVAGVDNEKFEELFDKFLNPETTYNLPRPDGGRTRVLFQEKQREALESIKENRRVSREQLAEMAKHPQAYFDPEIVELDPTDDTLSFSERVREIGIYQPRIYPFISPYKSEWIPGILVDDDKSDKRTRIPITTEKGLVELERTIEREKQAGKNHITWKGTKLPISEVEQHLPFIKKRLKRRKKPYPEPDEKLGATVLIIDENIEESDFVAPEGSSATEPFRHLLESTPNLKHEVKLLPHQEEGLAWAQQLWEKHYPGGLLADDMGLGKTLQVLCFLEWHHRKFRQQESHRKPHLIVAPIALLENWAAEYPKFFKNGALNFITLYGKELQNYKLDQSEANNIQIPEIEGAERLKELRKKRGALDVKRLQKTDVVLTTYETVRDFQLDLGLIHWATVIIDEAQKIKTPGTLVTNALKALNTDFRIAMTGTPVENSLMDLWCITDFVAPGYLDSAKNFNNEFCRPLENPETDIRALGEQIRKRIGVHFKRRLKTEILDSLPEKHIHVEKCQQEMPPTQVERYHAALQSTKDSGATGPQQRNRILQVLHQLRDISDHPLLSDSKGEESSISELIEQSAKLIVTVKLLKDIHVAGEKVILFAERRNTQHLLARVINEQFELGNISIVNGDTPGSKQREGSMKISRQQAVDRFQDAPGFNAIIMSPLSAGVGLNITEANHVIHYSRWWNPAKEDQASDRVYRIGQKRPVHIYLPMATHSEFKTFDVILHELLERKRQLSQDTLFPTERAEVKPAEILDALQSMPPETKHDIPLAIEDVDKLTPKFFEFFVAALFHKQGYKVEVTPYSGDKGADVVVHPLRSENSGFLIQVKQRNTGGRPGHEAVDEIVAAIPFYEEKYTETFQPIVITNRSFTKEAHQLSRTKVVQIYERKWIIENLKQYPVTWADVNLCQFQTV
ncbi:MAG: SNF2-related protein [Candidatus Poribacteria bacterium]|nr:SNF2-related protein [Candidatus Poribacteria bacterium]